jgi:hypothetical protein
LKTKAAAVPYRKKSYHSTAVPARLEAATVRRLEGFFCRGRASFISVILTSFAEIGGL